MAGRLAKHTSMRGRLALLLIAFLVVPMSLAGLLAHQSMDANGGSSEIRGRAGLETGEAIQIREEVLAFGDAIELSMAELSLVAAQAAADPARTPAPRDLAAHGGTTPARLLTVGGESPADPGLAPETRALAAALVADGRAFAGWDVLPGDAGKPGLFLVAYEPLAAPSGPAGILALREAGSGSGPGLLDAHPARSRLVRSLLLGQGPLVARSEGSQFGQGDASATADGAALDALKELTRAPVAAPLGDDVNQGEVPSGVVDEIAWGLLPLRNRAGVPVAAAVVQAHRTDLSTPEPTLPMGTRVRTLLGWTAVSGVLLALAIAFLAPRWIWGDIRQATDSIFHSVERLRELVRRNSRALDEQSRVIRTLTSSTSALKLSSQSISDTTRALAHSAEQSAWVSQSGNQKAELSQRAVLEVRDRVEQISVQMEELERRCGDIGKILVFIDHLSNQTNTLSVNATIQAVGAGSSGRQVSVVADEIRKLADLALESTGTIQQLIEQIQESSVTTLSATREGCREVDKCLASFEELESAFARILRWVEETTRGSHGIEQSTARQSDSLESVVLSIEELEQRAGETAGNFHEVVAAADELARLGADMNETWRVG
jgi:hypothetical protein